MPKAVVIIDDDESIHIALKTTITNDLKMDVESFYSAEEFLKASFLDQGRMYLVDWDLPGMKGPDLIEMIRARDKYSPIFVISGYRETVFVTRALKSGADDFLFKPFNPEHLILKLVNAKTRTSLIRENLVSVGTKLFPEFDVVMKDGKRLKLTTREFQTFNLLYENFGEVILRDNLDNSNRSRNADFLICTLRKKIGHINYNIETIRGQGYKLIHV